MAALTINRPPAIVNETIGDGFAQVLDSAKVGEVAIPGPGHQGMQRVVKIVVPLSIDPVTADYGWINHARIVQIALGDEPCLAPEQMRLPMEDVGHLVQQMIRSEVEDLVDRIEPQRIDVVLSQPVQRVVDEETPYLRALRTVEIDRGTPWRAITIREIGAVLAQVVSFRTQMVIDDVQHYREPFVMTGVDEPL